VGHKPKATNLQTLFSSMSCFIYSSFLLWYTKKSINAHYGPHYSL
jgi:hypothetical protein